MAQEIFKNWHIQNGKFDIVGKTEDNQKVGR